MLREHFRCVPDIIGFSNWLSYNGKIKPLRDISDCKLLPFTVAYRVDGQRDGKTNDAEQKAIIALMKACMERDEYADKTFGVITLLGDAQTEEIQKKLTSHISASKLKKHKVLCGNPSNFQGDERDVILLSMVDSSTGNGPLRMVSEGTNDAIKKRYNVAVSRARDQLWVVHSLDRNNDLKMSDMRKRLLDYVAEPQAFIGKDKEIEQLADSPFEVSVAKKLVADGFHIVQQWKVGAYRIDMVAVCGNKRIAIECDGERYHSGDKKIAEDMERQTILERLGWHFIRIRGSQYYSDPEKTMDKVIQTLYANGIEPENITGNENNQSSVLLDEVKIRASEILENWSQDRPTSTSRKSARTLFEIQSRSNSDNQSYASVQENDVKSKLEGIGDSIEHGQVYKDDTQLDDKTNEYTKSSCTTNVHSPEHHTDFPGRLTETTDKSTLFTGEDVKPIFDKNLKGIWTQLTMTSKLNQDERKIAKSILLRLDKGKMSSSDIGIGVSILKKAIDNGFVVNENIRHIVNNNTNVIVPLPPVQDDNESLGLAEPMSTSKHRRNESLEKNDIQHDSGLKKDRSDIADLLTDLKKEGLEAYADGNEVWVVGETSLGLKLAKYRGFKFLRTGSVLIDYRPGWVKKLK